MEDIRKEEGHIMNKVKEKQRRTEGGQFTVGGRKYCDPGEAA